MSPHIELYMMYGGAETLHAHTQKKGMRIIHRELLRLLIIRYVWEFTCLEYFYHSHAVFHANFQPYVLCGWKVSIQALKKH